MFACLINLWFLCWKKKKKRKQHHPHPHPHSDIVAHSWRGFGEGIDDEKAACPNYPTAALLKLMNGRSFGRNEFTIFWPLISKRQSMAVNVYETYTKCSTSVEATKGRLTNTASDIYFSRKLSKSAQIIIPFVPNYDNGEHNRHSEFF